MTSAKYMNPIHLGRVNSDTARFYYIPVSRIKPCINTFIICSLTLCNTTIAY